ncbi:MAG: hypothetical protein HKN50_09065 [Gammaproteobacteria bacterium]|nr:hypothetical protein [Gammaproteobacteria bacterium]
MQSNKPLLVFVTVFAGLFAQHTSAQIFGNQNNQVAQQAPDNHVTVYTECDFRGLGRRLPAGEYRDMGAIQLKNDSISSVRIPAGLELNVFQNENFDGFSTRFTGDIVCLDKGWNNQISSLRVTLDRSVDTRATAPGGSYYTNRDVNASSVARIEFSGTVLEQSGDKRWRITGQNGQGANFNELSRNDNAVYLQAERNGEKVRIDFFTNDVTILAPGGQQASYPLDVALKVDSAYRAPAVQPVAEKRSAPAVIRGRCFDYVAQTTSGNGGVRFSAGNTEFQRFSTAPIKGRVCHQGKLEMEINKTDPAAGVQITIQGKTYRFAPNEKHDLLLNNWYRKRVNLMVTP